MFSAAGAVVLVAVEGVLAGYGAIADLLTTDEVAADIATVRLGPSLQ